MPFSHRTRSAQRIIAIILSAFIALMASTLPAAAQSATAQDADPLATRVQILHAGVDTGDLEIFINGENVLDEFSYGEKSDWIDVDPGAVRVTFTADRTGFNYAVFDSVYPAPVGNDFYLVITDALVLSGSLDTASIAADMGRVQLLHASVDTPAVDVHVTGEGADATAQVAYAGNLEAVEAPAGTYTVEATLADGGTAVLTSDVTVEAGNTSVVVLIGDPTSEEHPLELVTLSAAVSTDEATPAA